MAPIRHKRGATLSWVGALADSDGAGVDLTGYTLTAEIRDSVSAALVSDATITLADQDATPGRFTLSVAASDTEDWTAGDSLIFDVRVVSGSGHVDVTETVEILVVERVTAP